MRGFKNAAQRCPLGLEGDLRTLCHGLTPMATSYRRSAAESQNPRFVRWKTGAKGPIHGQPFLCSCPSSSSHHAFVLVLVLVLGVSASSLKLRFATSIPSRKMAWLRLNCEAMPCNSLGRQSEELIRRIRRSCKATAGVPPISAHNP